MPHHTSSSSMTEHRPNTRATTSSPVHSTASAFRRSMERNLERQPSNFKCLNQSQRSSSSLH